MVVLLPCCTEYQARWRIQKLTPLIRALKCHCASQGAALRTHRTLSSLSPAAAHLHRTGISRREARRHQVVLSVYNQPPRHTGHTIRETAESNSIVHSSIANFPSGL